MTNKQKWINALHTIVFPSLDPPGRINTGPKFWTTNKIMTVMCVVLGLLIITFLLI
jgi:hypothetical protein